ncbi:MAG: hypothetical protein V2I48_14210 [Xanthomonadales bacterium]|nr:hypothetical protein [Xanthomonadales bacterium]
MSAIFAYDWWPRFLNPGVVAYTEALSVPNKMGPDTFSVNKCIRPLFQNFITGIGQSSPGAVVTRFSGCIKVKMMMRQ